MKLKEHKILAKVDISNIFGKGYQDGFRQGLQDGRLKQVQELKARIIELSSQLPEGG